MGLEEYCSNFHTKSNLQIQCNPIKIPIAFFTEIKLTILICMEIQKTQNSQNSLGKEQQSCNIKPLITIVIKTQCGTGIKIDTETYKTE